MFTKADKALIFSLEVGLIVGYFLVILSLFSSQSLKSPYFWQMVTKVTFLIRLAKKKNTYSSNSANDTLVDSHVGLNGKSASNVRS